MSELIHIAGSDVTVNGRLRQRCAWCGAVLRDWDPARVAVPEGRDRPVGGWPVGELVAVDGGSSWTVAHEDGMPLPDGACARLDPEVTA